MVPKPSKKAKKPLETTLGKASAIPKEVKDVDLSHVRKPIDTSLFGLRQVLSLFKTGTEEVQNYITFECDLMYECRICRTIFRSLANFILHKRNYCRERYNPLGFPKDDDEQESCSVIHSTSKDKHNDDATTKKSETPCITSIVDRLKERQEVVELNRKTINEDFSKEKDKNYHKETVKSKTTGVKNIVLEEIPTTSAAVFQTFFSDGGTEFPKKPEFMKTEVMEIHSILDENEAVLDSTGKVCEFETNKISKIPKGSLFCTECNIKFSTKKTLSHHLKYKHNKTQLVYICPDCKDHFANAWCVYRHLMKVHRKTSQQIRRLRQQIHNSVMRKDHCPKKKKDNSACSTVEEPDEENQWLTNVEDSYFQMCGGCGKRFERKAALHSHVTMCLKRMAVCNTIKENNAKKREEETKGVRANGKDKSSSTSGAKGASKRKSYLLRTYKPRQLIRDQDCDENANSGTTGANCCEGDTKKTAEKPCSTTITSGNEIVLIPDSTLRESVPPYLTNISKDSTLEAKHTRNSKETPALVGVRSQTMGVDDPKQDVDIVASFSATIKDEDALHKWDVEDACVTCAIETKLPSTSAMEDTDAISEPEKTLQRNDTDIYEKIPDVIILEDSLNELESLHQESSRHNTSESTVNNKARVPPAEDRQDHIADTIQCECIVLSDSNMLASMFNKTDSVAKIKDTILIKSESITSNEEIYDVPFESMTSEITSCLKDGTDNIIPSVIEKSRNTEKSCVIVKNRNNEGVDYNEDMPEVKGVILPEITEDNAKGKNSKCSISTTSGYMLNDSKNVEDIVSASAPSLIKPTICSIGVLEGRCSLLTTESNSNDSKIKLESLVPYVSTTSKEQEYNTATKSEDVENSLLNTYDTKGAEVSVPLVDSALENIPSKWNRITRSNYKFLSFVNQSNEDKNDEKLAELLLKDKNACTEDLSNEMFDFIEDKDIISPLNKTNDDSDRVAKENKMLEDQINTNHMLNTSIESFSKIKLRPIVEMLESNSKSKVDSTDDESIPPKNCMNVAMKQKHGSAEVPLNLDSGLAKKNALSIISISSDDSGTGNQDKGGAKAEKPATVRKLNRDKLGRFSSDSRKSRCVLQKYKTTRRKTGDDNLHIEKCAESATNAECRKIVNKKKRGGSPKKSDEMYSKSPENNRIAYKENDSMTFNECILNLKKIAADENLGLSGTPKICRDSDGRDSSPELRGFPHEEPESLKAVKSLIEAVTRDWAESDPGVEEIKSSIEWTHVSGDMKMNINEPSGAKITEVLERALSRDQNQKHKSPKSSPKGHKSAKSCKDKKKIMSNTQNSSRSREPKIGKNESQKTRKSSFPVADEKNYVIDNIGTRIVDYIFAKDESTGNKFATRDPKSEEMSSKKQQFEKQDEKIAVQKRGLKRQHAERTAQRHEERKYLKQELEQAFGGIVQKALPYMDVQLLQCKSCHKAFSRLTKLISHMSAHFSWFRYQCSGCTLVSYSKTDCIDHVIEQHRVSQEYLSSMVLPIPSWKTLLMSHDFKELEEHEDTTGKHIDEIIVGYNEEPICIDDDEVVCSSSNETEKLEMVPHPDIDVTFNDDTQQVEVPTEICSCEPYELLNLVEGDFGDRVADTSDEFPVVEDFTELADDTSDFFGDLFDAPVLNSGPYLTEDTTHPGIVEIEGEPSISTKHVKREPVCVLPSDRPMRNRIKSEKSDFVYDMKAVKLNKLRTKSKNGSIASTTTTSTKSINPSKGLKSIKVYTKKQQ